MNEPLCLLCNARGAIQRPGRLGRYAQTCDRCEQRRGAHAEHAGGPAREWSTSTLRAVQWSARPR